MKTIFNSKILWLFVGGIIFFILGLKKENKNPKTTKNGFQSEKMEDIYNYYVQKQKTKM